MPVELFFTCHTYLIMVLELALCISNCINQLTHVMTLDKHLTVLRDSQSYIHLLFHTAIYYMSALQVQQ